MRPVAESLDLYPDSCAVAGNGINLACPLVHRHFCAASSNVAADFERRGRPTKSAAIARTAIAEFGCPEAMFQPAR